MLSSVKLDGVSQYAEVVFGGGFFGLLDVVFDRGHNDSGEDAEDSDYYKYFHERK
jgi:hypothetical protein